MKIQCFEKFDIVTADEGMMLTNGEIVSDQLHTPCNADLSAWREIHKEEAERIIKEHEERLKQEMEA